MNDSYLSFTNNELIKSKILAKELNISETDFIIIQNWFDFLLLKHSEATSDFELQKKSEQELKIKFNELISSEVERKSYKYILPKLLHYNNVFNDDFLRSLYVPRLGALLRDDLIPKLVNDKKIVYSAEDFFHNTIYLKDNYFVSPNSNFLEDILKIENIRGIFKHSSTHLKFESLKNIIQIIHQKTFHHDIICFKKILKLVSEKDSELIDYLKNFQVANKQGCYKIINDILNLDLFKNNWNDFEIKVQLICFFDTARGANPTSSWKNKFQELSGIIDKKMFLEIVHAVLKNENCRIYEFDYGAQWGDDTTKRFLKSAQWIKIFCYE
jgi:hypothetical protein